MGLLNKLFGKPTSIASNQDFWNWFVENENGFFKAVKSGNNISKDFFDIIGPKLDGLREGYFFLTGMCEENIAELIITAEGNLKNIGFVEDLIDVAPAHKRWKFTAHKPPSKIEDVSIKMGDFTYDKDNLSFHVNEHQSYPDEIDITVVYRHFDKEQENTITNGIYIFLDNYLGEIRSITTIDNLCVEGPSTSDKEVIPIEKLSSYLIWREKEFSEKYEGTMYETSNDSFYSLEAQLPSGKPLLGIFNRGILTWDGKASHPWMLKVNINYKEENNGMPGEESYQLLNQFEDELIESLKPEDGYLNIGRETFEGLRRIHFACADFRKPSKALTLLIEKYKAHFTEIDYDLFKDKYWQCLDRFQQKIE